MSERLTDRELQDRCDEARQTLGDLSVWKHKKTGNLYRVVGVALREEDCVPLALYRRTAHTGITTTAWFMVWSRPVSEFVEKFVREEQ